MRRSGKGDGVITTGVAGTGVADGRLFCTVKRDVPSVGAVLGFVPAGCDDGTDGGDNTSGMGIATGFSTVVSFGVHGVVGAWGVTATGLEASLGVPFVGVSIAEGIAAGGGRTIRSLGSAFGSLGAGGTSVSEPGSTGGSGNGAGTGSPAGTSGEAGFWETSTGPSGNGGGTTGGGTGNFSWAAFAPTPVGVGGATNCAG